MSGKTYNFKGITVVPTAKVRRSTPQLDLLAVLVLLVLCCLSAMVAAVPSAWARVDLDRSCHSQPAQPLEPARTAVSPGSLWW